MEFRAASDWGLLKHNCISGPKGRINLVCIRPADPPSLIHINVLRCPSCFLKPQKYWAPVTPVQHRPFSLKHLAFPSVLLCVGIWFRIYTNVVTASKTVDVTPRNSPHPNSKGWKLNSEAAKCDRGRAAGFYWSTEALFNMSPDPLTHGR